MAMQEFITGQGSSPEDSQHQDHLSTWKGPRKVTLQRRSNGFGFTLRHFIVYPPESAVAELNRQQDTGGDEPKHKNRISALEPMDTIFVKQVKADGPAHQAGLANGDRIVSVNGESVTGKTYQQVVNLIQLCDTNLTLFVVPREEDILQVAYPSSAYKTVNQMSGQSRHGDGNTSAYGIRDGIRDGIQARREADRGSQSCESNLSSLSDDHDVVVIGKGNRESEDTESGKERNDISFLTDDSSIATYEGAELHHRGEGKILTYAPNSDVYRGARSERKFSEGRQPYKVQRVTVSSVSHESVAPMKVTVVNPCPSSGDSPTHGPKEQRTFRLTNVLNTQTSSKQPALPESSNCSALDSQWGKRDEGSERKESHTQRHIASLRSYYEAAKLANSSVSSDANSSQSSTEKPDAGRSSKCGYSSSADNLLSQSGFASPQAVLRTQPQRGMNSSSSCDDLLVASVRSDVGRQNRQVSIIAGQSVQRSSDQKQQSGSGNTWQNDQESVKVSKSAGIGNARITLRVEDPDIRDALSHEASLQRGEYTSQATRVTVSASVSADNLSQSARNINVRHNKMAPSSLSPKHETRSRALTASQESVARNAGTTTPGVPISRSQTMASGRVVHLVGQRQVLPDKPQDSISYTDKKPVPMGEDSPDAQLSVTDGASLTWRRTGSRRGSAGSDGSEGRPSAVQGKQKPPVPKRDSSRVRVRERSLERERQRERTMHERHRSRSYDRAHQRTTWSQFQAFRKNAGEALPEGIQMDDGALMRPGRKDSSASSNSAGSGSGEKEGKVFPAFNFKGWRPRSTSLDYQEPRQRSKKESAIVRYGSWSAKRGSGGKMKEISLGAAYRRLVQMKEGQNGRQRLVRRTSYLRATGSDGEEEEEELGDSGSVSSSQEGERPSREKTTPKRNASIRKTKSFFSKGTPKLAEATQPRRPSMIELLGSEPVVKEGPMNVKLAPSRSWKPVWAVLKGQVNKLFLMKEQRDQTSQLSLLEQPISLNGSSVDIAYDYTKKKKNVIRLTNCFGLTLLLQVSDAETMLSWIKVIQEHNDPNQSEKENNLMQLLERSAKGDPQAISTTTHTVKVPSPNSYRKKFFKSGNSSQGKPRPSAKEDMLAKAKASQSFADRMKRHIRGRGRTGGFTHPVDDNMQASATFGVPLEQCTPSHSNELVPMVVEICCSIVEAKGVEVVGIYRVPGNTGGISYLKEELKKGVDEIDLSDERWHDVNVISSLLKLFFRKLPDPLVPNNQYKAFIAANRRDEPSERMWALRRQVHNLPDHHYETFKYLVNHLKGVAANSHINRMEVRNLAIVFGPTLVRSGDDSMVTMVTDMSDQCKIVESLVQHCDWFFSDDVESQQDVPSDALCSSSGGGGGTHGKQGSPLTAKKGRAEEEDEDELRDHDMDKTPPLKTSSMEDLSVNVGSMFNTKDLIFSVNAAAQRKLKSPNKPYAPADTAAVRYRRPSPEPQLHTIKLNDQDTLRLNVGQAPITIDIGNPASRDSDDVVKGNGNTGRVVMRHNSVDSKSRGGSAGSGSPIEMEALLQGSVFGSSNRAYHPRAYYQNFHFGSTRGRKLSESSENSNQYNLDRELKTLTSSTSKRDSWVQSDYSKERERIEREHEEALRDLEKENDTNIEELFKSRDYLSELTAVSNKIMDYTKKGVASPSASRKQSVETPAVMTHSKSSNNNNAFISKHEPRKDSIRKQLSIDNGGRHNSPLHIDEIDAESDFVQSMKATFEERLQKVLHHESEDDSSRPTSLVVEKDATPATYLHADDQQGIHYRSNSVDRPEVLRRRLESPRREISSSGSSSLSGSPSRSKDGIKSVNRTKTSHSPSHSPKKCSRIEVLLTMEKRESTPPPIHENVANNSQEESRYRKPSSKDTASLREKQREKRRRRHTVGGGKDLKDFQKAISEHLLSKGDAQKMSAVERLKPFGKENVKSASKPQDIKSWLVTERQRSATSSPNLLSTVQASIARMHPTETDKQRRDKELRRKSTPILGSADFNNDVQLHKLSRMPRYFEIESYL